MVLGNVPAWMTSPLLYVEHVIPCITWIYLHILRTPNYILQQSYSETLFFNTLPNMEYDHSNLSTWEPYLTLYALSCFTLMRLWLWILISHTTQITYWWGWMGVQPMIPSDPIRKLGGSLMISYTKDPFSPLRIDILESLNLASVETLCKIYLS